MSKYRGGNRRGYSNNRFKNNRRGNRKSRNNFKKHIDRSMYINQPDQTEIQVDNYNGISYSEFRLNEKLSSNLNKKNFKVTTEIQEQAIPFVLDGRDVLGISATGSGKTGAFLIPLVEKLLENSSQKVLIVAPTRELALQIVKEAVTLIEGTHLRGCLVVGGENMRRQINQLKKGGHIVVGTPGRLNDLIKRGNLRSGEYKNLVIDEVDRMLDMGFIRDIQFIFDSISKEHQSLFFSATLDKKVEKIVQSLSPSYELIKLAKNEPSKNVAQSVIDYRSTNEKLEHLKQILSKDEVEKAIIFVETKRFADQIEKELFEYRVAAIHGNKKQNTRKRIITGFRESRINYLIATNVAARGIDVDDITHIINFDEPNTYDEYIHRIGRTGRNGKLGTAYTFVRSR